MKSALAVLSLLVTLLVIGFFYHWQQTSSLEVALAGLAQEDAALHAELRRLDTQLRELQGCIAAVSTTRPSTGAAEPGRSAETKSPPVAPVAQLGITVAAPAGWHKNGAKPESYVVGVDSNQTWGGMPSAYVQSLAPTVESGFGGMMQTTAAESYVGKRVRLSGWIKTEDANEGGGHLWLRIDGQERGQMLGFDNMQNRAVKGTSDWQEASVVLDVPSGASALAYGFFVSGGGKMWVNGQRIEVVSSDVPTTNLITKQPLPPAPRNLGFDPNK